VVPNRPTEVDFSAEDTFERISSAETEPMIRRLAEKVWNASRKGGAGGPDRGAEAEDAEFEILTRSHTLQPSGVVRGAYGDCSGASRAGGLERSGGMCRSSC